MAKIRTKTFSAYLADDDGAPATGLSPTITIYNTTDGTTPVSGASMTEVGGGFYKYSYTEYDYEKDYLANADGGATLTGANRYAPMGNDTDTRGIRDGISADHGSSLYTKSGFAVFGDKIDSKDIDKLVKQLTPRLIKEVTQAIEKKKLDISYTLDTQEAEKTLKTQIQRISDAAQANITEQQMDLSGVMKSLKDLRQIVKEKEPDNTEIFEKIEQLKTDISSTISERTDKKPILEAVSQLQEILIGRIGEESDALVEEIMERLDEADEENAKKKKALLEAL